MDIKRLITDYLEKALLLQIATSDNGIPWICTVCFAYDSEFNLYWFSRHNTRHSQEISRNPCVAGAVVQPYALGDKSRGLQFAGSVSELHQKQEVFLGLLALQKRYDVKNKRIIQLRKEILFHLADYGLYRLRPDSIILYDTITFPDSPRQVYVPGTDMARLHLEAQQ
ncbi:MAG TPA: pyridoxamine 5'-phosphate oxidase family protein [Candidatus Acidoferrales bacterium]|nr:pyridoxamine 5'-phosphate oxidase family protein [Candidatus Acidoferrales bacterium]